MKSRLNILALTGFWCALALVASLSISARAGEPVSPAGGGKTARPDAASAARIQPYPANPFYWQYKGTPVLLLGGSSNDSLFQGVSGPDRYMEGHQENLVLQGEGVEEELDLIKLVGGNYVRNVMSDRKGVRAFRQLADGKYDLSQWNDTYWQRFEDFLRWTEERDIVVGIEVWDRFDFDGDPWQSSPYKPSNNVNYTEDDYVWVKRNYYDMRNPFFHTVPALENNTVVIQYQQRFVDKMLSHTLSRGNVLYIMDNEYPGSPEWGKYWANHIRARASAQGKTVYLTEMWRDQDLTFTQHLNTLDHPEIYDFCDISQNSMTAYSGERHWTNIQWVRQYLLDRNRPWPINSTKIYGADGSPGGSFGDTEHAIQIFYKQIVGGQAVSRFHRPHWGIGIGSTAQTCIKTGRMLESVIKLWEVAPRQDLLVNRATDSTYLAAQPGQKYALYFNAGGSGTVGLNLASGTYQLRWLNGSNATWGTTATLTGSGTITLNRPGSGHWFAVITRQGGTSDLAGHWKFDDGSDSSASDNSYSSGTGCGIHLHVISEPLGRPCAKYRNSRGGADG